MGLKECLSDQRGFKARLRVGDLEPIVLARVLKELSTVDDLRLPIDELPKVQTRLFEMIAASALGSATRRELRIGASGYMTLPRPLGRDIQASIALLDEVERRQQRSALLPLISVYLEHFDPDDGDVRALGERLAERLPRWRFRGAEAWSARAAQWCLFDPEKGPRLLAARVMRSEPPPSDVLSSAGLSEARSLGGYAQAAFRAACEEVRLDAGGDTESMQLRLIAWASLAARALAYPRLWSNYARALLEPWDERASEGRTRSAITEEHRTRVTNALVAYAGDPRIDAQGKWAVLDVGRAKQIIMRWLTRASVLQFLDIVDRTSGSHMWDDRRAFWTSYLLAGHIDTAWVVLGPTGERLALEAAGRSLDEGLRQFGRVRRGTGRSAEHSALIMEIGDLLVVDWSHNGKYNVWTRNDVDRPQLFQPEYSGHDLSGAPLRGAHLGDWQGRISTIIAEHTRRRVQRSDWQPKRSR